MINKSQKAVGLMESAIIIPVFILLTFAVFDIARWYNLHHQISRIAYEGARYGASISGLKPHSFNSEEESVNFYPNNKGEPIDGQIYTRIDILRDNRGLDPVRFEVKAYRKDLNSDENDTVVVEVKFLNQPFFSLLNIYKDVKVIAEAPYLFRNKE